MDVAVDAHKYVRRIYIVVAEEQSKQIYTHFVLHEFVPVKGKVDRHEAV